MRRMARIVAGVVAIAAVAVAGVFVYEWLTLRAARNHTEASRDPLDPWRRYRLEPTVAPAVEAADAAGLNDAEIVVGVVVGGRARAYRLDAMRDREKHVVNDMIGGVAVSVAYCDLTDCVRGYTDASAAQPLDVAVEGLYLGEMAIKAHGGLFIHRTGVAAPGSKVDRLPYAAIDPVRTTWGEWRRLHPRTDVYTGRR